MRLFLIFILSLGFALSGCDSKEPATEGGFEQFVQTAGMEPDQAGQVAPDFEYTLLDGGQGRLSDLKGNLVFLNFWATWCFPCKKEMPDIEELQAEMKGQPFKILAVSTGEGKEKVGAYHEKFPYSFPFALDPDSSISGKYGVNMLPTTFLISPEGKILAKAIGPRHWSAEEFINQVRGQLP